MEAGLRVMSLGLVLGEVHLVGWYDLNGLVPLFKAVMMFSCMRAISLRQGILKSRIKYSPTHLGHFPNNIIILIIHLNHQSL